MDVKVGCDLVFIRRFKESMDNGGVEFLNKIFTSAELANASKAENLAGMFAAKEAVIKALDMKAGDWHKIEIIKEESGRPKAKMLDLDKRIMSYDISISHDGEYAMAVAVFLIKTPDN